MSNSFLFYAREGFLEDFERMLSKSYYPQEILGRALGMAAKAGHLNIVKSLIDKYPDCPNKIRACVDAYDKKHNAVSLFILDHLSDTKGDFDFLAMKCAIKNDIALGHKLLDKVPQVRIFALDRFAQDPSFFNEFLDGGISQQELIRLALRIPKESLVNLYRKNPQMSDIGFLRDACLNISNAINAASATNLLWLWKHRERTTKDKESILEILLKKQPSSFAQRGDFEFFLSELLDPDLFMEWGEVLKLYINSGSPSNIDFILGKIDSTTEYHLMICKVRNDIEITKAVLKKHPERDMLHLTDPHFIEAKILLDREEMKKSFASGSTASTRKM